MSLWWGGFLYGSATVAAIVFMILGFIQAWRIEEGRDVLPALAIFLVGAALAWFVLARVD